jgi:phosphopantothenoylcysteine decarboxylase/phosphopantothenate--cysteine ligase
VSPIDAAEVPRAVRGLRVAVCVGGGIAAYKIPDLVSQLVQAGCQVRVAMTPSATRFVGPTTFHGISGHPVQTSIWAQEGAPEPHVELGDWARLLLVAPATANLLAKIGRGQADDLVTATVLAARCPVVVAPAMNDAMWAKPAVQQNVDVLRSRGLLVVEPEAGHLASGHVGAGRLAGTATIFAGLAAAAASRYDLAGRRVVVSAGGTREPIDPVRFISNYSSGKMGFAIAEAAEERGASVVLVSTAQHPSHAGIEVRPVETAAEMLATLKAELPGADLLVMAAAVADFRPAHIESHKIRREENDELVLRLDKNVDILSELSRQPGVEGVYRVGFAAEGGELEQKATEKLARKGLDAIVANDISRRDIAFGSEYNEGLMVFRDGQRVTLERSTKRVMADRILDQVVGHLR